ncbi:MAG TPA: TolC family protein, partial [Candidatus Omnitrophota bacterium]|nr:TolC family protein [Candidatus Omnitrophota bacterium]
NQRVLENQFAHLEAIKEKHAKGEASESEMLKAVHSLSDARYLQEASLNQLENAKTLFKDILALEDKAEVEISGDFDYSPREIAVDSAILKALEARPEIREYAAREKADAAAVEIARSGGRPSIYGTFDYYSRSTTSLTFSPGKGWQDYNAAGFTFSWPVFDGWLTKAKVEQALSDLKQDRIMRDKLQADIASQVKNAYLSLKTALAGLEPRKREIELYQDYLKTAEDKYKEGILSALGLDDVRLALRVSDFNRRQGLYDCLAARAELDLAMGVK